MLAQRKQTPLLVPHPWDYVRFRTDFVPGTMPDRLTLRAVVDNFRPAPHHLSLRSFLAEGQKERLDAAGPNGVLHISARAAGRASDKMQVALVETNGSAWGTVVDLKDTWQEITIPLRTLRRIPLTFLPRPYPQFLPYMLETAGGNDPLDLGSLDGLQFSVGVDLFEGADQEGSHGFEIERIVLEYP